MIVRLFRAVNTAESNFAMLTENDFKNFEVVSRLNLSYIFIKVMHEFDSRLFCGNQKSQSKSAELLCKRIQTYWQSLHRRSLLVDCNFTQNKARIFWHILVPMFLWVKDRNATWRPNGIFKHKSCPNRNMQVWFIYSLTYLCSQLNPAYHLYSVCIAHHHLIRWMM